MPWNLLSDCLAGRSSSVSAPILLWRNSLFVMFIRCCLQMFGGGATFDPPLPRQRPLPLLNHYSCISDWVQIAELPVMKDEITYIETIDKISNDFRNQALQDMKTLVPLQHGGHAFVFKTLENMVLKIVGILKYVTSIKYKTDILSSGSPWLQSTAFLQSS